MKKTILMGLLMLVLVLAMACTPAKPTPSPSPMLPTMPPASVAPMVTDPVVSATPAGTAGVESIVDFEEGKTVVEADLPQKVADAIKKAYNNVKIKTITYVTYLNDQVYHVVLEEPAGTEKVAQFYIKADGTIVPYNATASAIPTA